MKEDINYQEKVWDDENLSEQEEEKSPVYSVEEQRVIDNIDDSIGSKENFLAGLGRIARNEIFANDTKALEEIYENKIIGEVELKGKYDAKAFKQADKSLIVRNGLKKFFTLGMTGSKYAMEGEKGLVDKRNLKEGYKDKKVGLQGEELEETLKELGVDLEENISGVKSQYNEKGTKTVFREKIAQEADQAASEIFERHLKGLETDTGGDLVQLKDRIEAMQKEIEKYKIDLGEKATQKLEDEKSKLEEIKKEKQEELNKELEPIRSPLENHQKELAGDLENLLALSKDATAQDESYKKQIKDLNDKITRIKGSKVIKDFLGDEINEWEEQKSQLEANKKAFAEKRQALEIRLTGVKNAKAEIDKTLTKINSIGKTKEELSMERAEKDKKEVKSPEEKKQSKKENGESAEAEATNEEKLEEALYYKGMAIDNANESDRPELQREKEELQKAYDEIIKNKDNSNKTAKSIEKEKKKNKQVKKEGQPRFVAQTRLEKSQPIEPEKITKTVSEWLNILGVSNNKNLAKTAVENNFKTGKKFNLTSSMTLEKARQAYVNYILEFRPTGGKSFLKDAQDEANAKFEKIIK